MSLQSYKWKNRILLVKTPSYNYPQYLEVKTVYKNNMYAFHKRYVKMVTQIKKEFSISLIGFDGKVKKNYKSLNNLSAFFKFIDDMPMAKSGFAPRSLSLYENYNPKTTVSGLGFKNEEKALYTIDKIKDMPLSYQVRVVSTMLGRAKHHPYKTSNMKEAQNIFQKWLNQYHRTKNSKA